MAIESRLYDKYIKEIVPSMKEEYNLNVMQIPKIEKIVINMGLGKAVNDKGIINDAVKELALITGQQPVTTKAKKSIASFKLRQDMPIGVKVTLRGQKMYDFLDKLISISLPRIRDFRGLNANSFDQFGNYTFGVTEHIIFPEIEYDKVKLIKGLDITFVTSTTNNEHAYKLLLKLGMPFGNKFKGEKN